MHGMLSFTDTLVATTLATVDSVVDSLGHVEPKAPAAAEWDPTLVAAVVAALAALAVGAMSIAYQEHRYQRTLRTDEAQRNKRLYVAADRVRSRLIGVRGRLGLQGDAFPSQHLSEPIQRLKQAVESFDEMDDDLLKLDDSISRSLRSALRSTSRTANSLEAIVGRYLPEHPLSRREVTLYIESIAASVEPQWNHVMDVLSPRQPWWRRALNRLQEIFLTGEGGG